MIRKINEGQSIPTYGENGLRMFTDKINKAYYKCALPMYSAINISDNELDMLIESPDFPRYRKEILESLNLIRSLAKDTARQLETTIKILDNGYSYKNESVGSRKIRRKNVNESVDNVDGYAVQIRDMGKGYTHLLLFSTYDEAKNAYDSLDAVEDAEYSDEFDEYDLDMYIQSVLDSADDIVNEIDWRNEIDRNNVWTASDDTRYEIVGKVDLWLYW